METFSFASLTGPDNLRRLASRTIETYPIEWKVVHETLQNAKDAIRRGRVPGKIEIELDVAEQAVTVKDSGAGFPHNKELLGFGGTDKDTDPDWGLNGRQGVGLKAVILATKLFELTTVHQGNAWSLKINHADTYLSGGEPVFEMSSVTVSEAPSGTSVRYVFEDGVVSKVLTDALSQQYGYVKEALAGDEREKLQVGIESYFRSYTYAGDVNALLSIGTIVPTEITVRVVARGPITGALGANLVEVLASGAIETTFPSKHWDVEEAVDRTRARLPRPTVLTQALPPGGVESGWRNADLFTAGGARGHDREHVQRRGFVDRNLHLAAREDCGFRWKGRTGGPRLCGSDADAADAGRAGDDCGRDGQYRGWVCDGSRWRACAAGGYAQWFGG